MSEFPNLFILSIFALFFLPKQLKKLDRQLGKSLSTACNVLLAVCLISYFITDGTLTAEDLPFS